MQPSLFDDELAAPEASFAGFCERLGVEDSPVNWADRFGDALRAWTSAAVRVPVRSLSLFSGVGGLDIGFHDAGFKVQTSVEIEKKFVATLKANSTPGGYLDGTDVQCLDIRQYHPAAGTEIDFIIGGPPCQSFSAAGRRAAGVQGTQDDRGTLFQEYVRLLKLLRPRGFLFENVYGITGAEGGKAWETITGAFREAGYTIFYRILDAADYGVPQHRERMFIVGVREGEFHFPAPTHGPDSLDCRPYVSAEDAVAGAVVTDQEQAASVGGRFGGFLKQVPPGLNYSFFTEKMGHPEPIFAWRSKFSDYLYVADPKTPIRTLKAQGGQYTGPFHWTPRPFGLGELKRLQSIPDRYQIVGKRQVAIKQIGNSVPPQLARCLAAAILQQVFGVDLPCNLPLLSSGQQLGFRQRKRGLTEVYRLKATTAINENKPATPAKARKASTRNYTASLSDVFKWSPQDGPAGPLSVRCVLGKKDWLVRVDRGPLQPAEADQAFKIVLTTRPDWQWALGDQTVTLVGGTLERDVFVGAWRAFEYELDRLKVKADLVQLCEYYQYKPRFSAEMTISEKDTEDRWELVRRVVEGTGTRQILPAKEFARLWECEEKEVLPHALWLRTLGYEVRNHNTNQQIPEGSYLVPYEFPTLTPLSVQLRKTLVEVA